MKRLIFILSCLSVFYAGVVWAREGCRDIGAGHKLSHKAEGSTAHHHDNDHPSRHSHADPTQIHCPNVLSEFLISPRASLSASHKQNFHPAPVSDFASRL